MPAAVGRAASGCPASTEARMGAPGLLVCRNVAVAQKTGTQNGTLASGNMDQNLRNPSCLILSHTHVPWCSAPCECQQDEFRESFEGDVGKERKSGKWSEAPRVMGRT